MTDRTEFRVMLRRIDSHGVDFQNPLQETFETLDEAVRKLDALTPRQSPYETWVVTRTDWEGRAWDRYVVAEHLAQPRAP